MKKPRITVRSTARQAGRRIGSPNTFDVMRDGIRIATIQQDRDQLWFWYGMGDGPKVNTAVRPADFETVKGEAIDHCRRYFNRAPSVIGEDRHG